jgi:ATP-dependent Lon protease
MLFRNEKSDRQGPESGLRVPLLPLRDIIVFPHMVVPLFVGRQKSIRALEEAMNRQKYVLLAAQRDAKTNEPAAEDIFDVGTLGTVVQLLRLPDGTVKVLVEGKKRARIVQYLDESEYFLVLAEEIETPSEKNTEIEALVRSVNSTFENYVKLNKKIPPEMIMSVASIDDPAQLADTIVVHLSGRTPRKSARPHEIRDRDPRGREAHPYSRQEADGEDAKRVLPERADARDSKGTRGEGRVQERDPGTRRTDQAEEDDCGGPREGRPGIEEAEDDVADVR